MHVTCQTMQTVTKCFIAIEDLFQSLAEIETIALHRRLRQSIALKNGFDSSCLLIAACGGVVLVLGAIAFAFGQAGHELMPFVHELVGLLPGTLGASQVCSCQTSGEGQARRVAERIRGGGGKAAKK